jgi:hypothetical protein
MSDYFNLVNQYNNQAQEKVQHVAGLMNVADETLSATLENKKNELLGKWETGAGSLAGISGAWAAGRKVYQKLGGKAKPKPAEETEPDADAPSVEDEPQIEDLDAPEEFGEVMPDILTSTGAAPMSANAAAFGGGTSSTGAEASSGLAAEEGGGAAAEAGAEGAATVGAESAAGAASTAVDIGSAAATGSTAAVSTGVSTTADVIGSSLSSAGNMGASAGATAANVATPEATVALTSGTDAGATAGGALAGAESAGSVLDFLGPAGLAVGAVIGLVGLFEDLFGKKPPTAAELQSTQATDTSGGSIDPESLSATDTSGSGGAVGATQV